MENIKDSTIKFCACFGYSAHDFDRRQKPDESVYIEQGMNVSDFKRMLIKNDMDEYTNELLFYWYITLMNSRKVTNDNTKNFEELRKSKKEYEKELTETLIFLLSDESNSNMSITFQKSRNSITKNNNELIRSVIDALISDYDKNNFNEIELTFEEATDEIDNLYDKEWIKNYMKEIIEANPSLFDFDLDDYKYGDFFDEAFEICYDDQMIELYANEHYSKREVTLEFLQYKIKEITKYSKKKVGAKPKNQQIAVIGTNLSYLIRINKFISNSVNIKEINSINLTNKDYRFIHDCLVFFNLIEDYSIKEYTTTTPEKYIYTTLNQSKLSPYIKNRSLSYMYEAVLPVINKINNLK